MSGLPPKFQDRTKQLRELISIEHIKGAATELLNSTLNFVHPDSGIPSSRTVRDFLAQPFSDKRLDAAKVSEAKLNDPNSVYTTTKMVENAGAMLEFLENMERKGEFPDKMTIANPFRNIGGAITHIAKSTGILAPDGDKEMKSKAANLQSVVTPGKVYER